IELIDLAESFELVVSNSEEELEEPTIAYFNPKEELEDKRLREHATKRRIINFTEPESLKAFSQALKVTDFEIKALEDWHSSLSVKV
ncbi:hypothetical protein, partial [Bacillus cereus]